MGIPLCDLGAAVYAVIGVLGEVLGRRRATPAGRVEVAKLDVAVALLSYMGVGYFADGESPTRVGTGHSTIFPYNSFMAADGEVVVAPFTQRFWRKFCTAIGREDLTRVDSYEDFASRLRTKDELLAILEPVLRQRTVAEWIEVFRLVDVPAGPVLDVGGALELDQTVQRGLIHDMALADGSSERTVGSPFRFLRSDGHRLRAGPASSPLRRGGHRARSGGRRIPPRRDGEPRPGRGRGFGTGPDR